MTKPIDADLVAAFKADLSAAWDRIREQYPSERLYAFGLYTTEAAESFCPFACGNDGLHRVAQEYVRKGHYSNMDEAMAGLKWSIADSPYQDKLPYQRIDAELRKRPDPTDGQLPETASAREIRARLNAAALAIKSLDNEGLFGTVEERRGITLLIEAGDRTAEFVLKWARKLNAPAVFRAYESLFDEPTVGRWTEFGTKKVYETTQLSLTVDRRLVATASHYVGCVFDVVANKQLLCRPIPSNGEYVPIAGVAISRGGDKIGFASGDSNPRNSVLTVLGGPGWKSQRDTKMPAQPLCLASGRDGEWYAVGFTDNLVRIYHDASGEPTSVLKGHEHWPRTVAVSADGSQLASIDEKSGVRIWRTADWSLSLEVREARGTDVCFDTSGGRIATVRRWGRLMKDPIGEVLKIWTIPGGQLITEHRVAGFEFEVARFSPDGTQMACGITGVENTLHEEAVLLDTESGRVLHRLRGPFNWFTDFAFLPARNAIAIGVQGLTRRPLVLWELSDLEESNELHTVKLPSKLPPQ
jgi:hypothetical protein